MEKISDNARSQMRKGILEFSILLTIDNKKEAYASDIIHNLKEADLLVVEGTLYPLLSRLNRAKLLNYQWKESKSGPPRKYYRLTPAGKKILKELIITWTTLSNSINSLLSHA